MFATGGLKRVLPPSEYFEMNIDLKLDQEYMEILAKHLDAGNPLEP